MNEADELFLSDLQSPCTQEDGHIPGHQQDRWCVDPEKTLCIFIAKNPEGLIILNLHGGISIPHMDS